MAAFLIGLQRLGSNVNRDGSDQETGCPPVCGMFLLNLKCHFAKVLSIRFNFAAKGGKGGG